MEHLTVITSSELPINFYNPIIKSLIRLPAFETIELLHIQKIAALKSVTTEFCALLNEGDSLPYQVEDLIQKAYKLMDAEGTGICYTDIVRCYKDERGFDRVEYLPLAKQGLGRVINQFAVIRTDRMLEIINSLPYGLYWTEALLFKHLEGDGFSYVPKAACLFDADSIVSLDGKRNISQVNSFAYCINSIMNMNMEI